MKTSRLCVWSSSQTCSFWATWCSFSKVVTFSSSIVSSRTIFHWPIYLQIYFGSKNMYNYIYIYRLGILCIKWCSFLDLIFVYLYICIYTVSAFDHKSVTFHGRMKVAAVRVILWIPKLSSISLTTFWRQALITEDVCWQSAMGDRLKTSMESFFVTLSLATIQPAVVGMCSETWISYKLEPAGQWCAWSFVWSLDIVFFLKIFGSSIVRPFVVYI